MKNTIINLLYVDADNYKAREVVVVKGEITRDQAKLIKSNMEDGQFIIAHQVGLPTPSFQFIGHDGWPSEAGDHVWTTLEDFEGDIDELDIEALLTNDIPTLDMTIEQLTNVIATAKWDVSAEWYRMEASA